MILPVLCKTAIMIAGSRYWVAGCKPSNGSMYALNPRALPMTSMLPVMHRTGAYIDMIVFRLATRCMLLSLTLQALMTVAEEAGGAQDPGTGSKTRPADTALFALSQACLHQACREQLKLLGIHAVVDRVAKLHDASLATHCRSIQVSMSSIRSP